MQNDSLFQQFVILVSVEGLENKYNLELSRGTFDCGRLTIIPAGCFLFIHLLCICAFRVEGAKKSEVFGISKYTGHPDQEQARDSRAVLSVCLSACQK